MKTKMKAGWFQARRYITPESDENNKKNSDRIIKCRKNKKIYQVSN